VHTGPIASPSFLPTIDHWVKRPATCLSHVERGRGKDGLPMRYVEIILFIVPFVVFAAWRMTAAVGGGPSPRVIAASAALVALLFAALLWFHREGALPPDTAYVPATLQDGRIVPAHGAAR
jgi:Family of unknown function (DUF6111)